MQEEIQSGGYLAEYRGGNLRIAIGERQCCHEVVCCLERESTDLGNRFVVHGDRENGRGETLSLAALTRDSSVEGTESLLRPLPLCFGVLPLNVGEHAFETTRHRHFASVAVTPLDDDLVIVPVQHGVLDFFAEVSPRGVEAEVEVRSETLGEAFKVGVNQLFAARFPWQDDALPYSHRGVVEYEFDIGHGLDADTVAGYTRPERGIERERPRFDLGERQNMLVGARQLFTECSVLVCVNEIRHENALAEFQRGLDRVVEA
ncbi:unannotated protein [freshwater metagenome]|uniref:Unannotated protein n=1 Tax=freshwater metagenome TaxID=449393 RepID=A0A6J6B3N9_9ZZZZ